MVSHSTSYIAAPYPVADSLRNHKDRYQKRIYRNWIKGSELTGFRVTVKETDLQIFAQTDLTSIAKESVLTHRGYLEAYIRQNPEFQETLTPWPIQGPSPAILSAMIDAGRKANVGPMAAVAGALAESVGKDLLAHSAQVIVENGGDVFIHLEREITVGLFANTSPLSGRIGIRILKSQMPIGICTSSATVGHSLSFGGADAACILSKSCALADAAATAVGNAVKTSADISAAIEMARRNADIIGAAIIVGEKMGVWGELELVPLEGK